MAKRKRLRRPRSSEWFRLKLGGANVSFSCSISFLVGFRLGFFLCHGNHKDIYVYVVVVSFGIVGFLGDFVWEVGFAEVVVRQDWEVVAGTGFEPVKAMPADLQSAPVDRLGILPCGRLARARRLRQTSVELSTPEKLFELAVGRMF